MKEFANKLQSTKMALSLTKQVWQPIPSNPKEFVVSACAEGMVSNLKQGTTSQEQPVTTAERKDTT